MEHDQSETEVARRGAIIYLLFSAGMVLIFLLIAQLTGDFSLVVRIGGAIWVAILSLIISMPVVISRVKHQLRR